MSTTVIVGGGLSGLITANYLKKDGFSFLGLESNDVLGGRVLTGHHRVVMESSVRFIDELIPDLGWETIDEAPSELRKGQWVAASDDFESMERFYLNPRFYVPSSGFNRIGERLAANVEGQYLFHKTVVKVVSTEKKLVCGDGAEISYDRLIWCAPLDQLIRAYEGTPFAGFKVPKKMIATGGLSLDQEFTVAPFNQHNTVVIPFRFKDNKLRALGIRDATNAGAGKSVRVHWILFLENELLEHREEVAKCVRTLKRELLKAFPSMSTDLIRERMVFLPAISGDTVAEADSLQLSDDIIYVGTQLRLPETSNQPENLDLLFENCRKLSSLIPTLSA